MLNTQSVWGNAFNESSAGCGAAVGGGILCNSTGAQQETRRRRNAKGFGVRRYDGALVRRDPALRDVVRKAVTCHRTAMSNVKACVALRLFFLKSGLCFSFPAFRFSKRFLGAVNGLGRCSSCYPCAAPKGRHQLTRAVTAKKRARPISKSGRCQPQCGSGRAPFQIISVGLH